MPQAQPTVATTNASYTNSKSTKATTKVDAFKDAFYQTARNTPSSQKVQQEIKQIFMKPTKLVRACVFQEHHKFPATEAAAASKLLTGGDRALFTFVQVLGKQLDFKLYLANVCYKVTGDMMTEHRHRGYGYRYGDYGFDYDVFGDDGPGNSDEEAENYSMEDTEEEGYSIEVKAVVDLDGMPVSLPKLDLDEANIVNGKLDSSKPDQKTFYYEDGHCGELVHLWNLTTHTDALLDPEGFASVYRAFPAQWESLKEIFSKVVEHSSSNLTRGALLEKISAAAKGKKGVAAVTAWHKIQNGSILSNLKTAQPDEVEWLTGVVKKHDIDFFRDILLPQLRNQPHEKKFWFPFIKALNWEKAGISTLEATEVISLCVRHVVDKTPAYPQKPYDPRDEDDVPKRCAGYSEAKFSDPALTIELVQLCIDTANTDQCTVIFNRMQSGKGREAWKFYEALVPDMTKVIEANPDLRPLFKSFFENAVCEILDQRKEVSESMALALLQASHEFLTQLLTKERFEILAKESIQLIKSLARCLYSRVLPTLSDAAARDAISAIVAQCIERVVRDHRIPKWSSRRPSVIDLLNFAYDVGVGDSLSTSVLNELIAKDDKDDMYIMEELVPLVTGLHSRMKAWKTHVAAPQFSAFCAEVLKLFAQRLMPKKPTEQIPAQLLSFGCGRCYECTRVKAFFTTNTPFHSVTATAAVRAHVEKQLTAVSAAKYGVKWETSKFGRPYTLQIQKSESMVAHGKYKQRQTQGLQVLVALGDLTIEVQILGADFDSVYEAIAGTRAPSPEPSVVLAVTNSQENAKKSRKGALAGVVVSGKRPRIS